MKRFRNSLILSLAVMGFWLGGTAARAESLTVTLDAPFQSGNETVFEFTGTIDYTGADSTNDGGVTEYLNSDFSFVSGGTLDDSAYLNNAPLSMDPGDASGDIELFTVTVPAYNSSGTAADNTYTGFFEILGGPTDSSLDVLATEDFNIQVTPEPPSWELLAMALVGLLCAMRWTAFRRQAAV
jgi:hypothetical protein